MPSAECDVAVSLRQRGRHVARVVGGVKSETLNAPVAVGMGRSYDLNKKSTASPSRSVTSSRS
jgi:hypothetical protein